MRTSITLIASLVVGGLSGIAQADPNQDLAKFQEFFNKRFPGLSIHEFGNGAYALDPVARANWEAIEEFPPYEAGIEDGRVMWETPFANGKTYADCFGTDAGINARYPRWDAEQKQVVTLPLAINQCREANGEAPLKYKKGSIADLTAYIAYESRGDVIDVEVPQDPDALAAYEDGKAFYYSRRGQLNMSCAHCHVQYAGSLIRTETLSPALGHTTGWPVYRSKWGELGTLHRRYSGCNEQVRAKAFEAQGEEYRNLEYFMSYMNNGLELNGPSARK
jgi:sulfur-oxidizing protein SoxA